MIGKWENCLSVALTKSTASSVGDGCQMMLGRGTKNFGMIIYIVRQPVHIRIHAQMHLAGTSLCQRCLLPDEIPSAPSKHHKVSAFRRTIQCFLSNIGKTVLIVKRKTCVLELQHFKVNQILFLFQWFIDVFSPLPITGHLLFHYNRYKMKK